MPATANRIPSWLRTAVAAGSLLGLPSATFAATPADPSGTWLVQDGDARVLVAPCPRSHEHVCGYLVWTKEAAAGGDAGRDDKNPDPAKRERPVLGMQIMLGLDADGASYSGQLYDAENGKTYDAHVRREDASHLILKGCVLKFLCQSQTWTRVDDVAAGQLSGPVDGAGGPRSDAEWAMVRTAQHKTKH